VSYTDYSVVVKNRAPAPKAWRWEIYRAGNASSIKQSPIYFDTMMAARRAGKDALKNFWTNFFPDFALEHRTTFIRSLRPRRLAT
jgi:hypothetical protein